MSVSSEKYIFCNMEKEEKYMIRLTEEDRMIERAEGRAEERKELTTGQLQAPTSTGRGN